MDSMKSTVVSENLMKALSKLNQTQVSLDKKLRAIDDRITVAQIKTTTQA